MFSLQNQCDVLFDHDRTILCQFIWLQNSPIFLSQSNRTAWRSFTFRTRFENVRWHSSAVWIPQAFLRYPIAKLYVSFTILSNAPRFHKLSRNNMCFQICAKLLTPCVCWRITDWKIITLSVFHFLAQTLSSYTDRIIKNPFLTFPEGAL